MDQKQIGPWVIERILGAGGMGTVYLGKHHETGQVAAIKVLPASLAREEGFVERFKREIDSMETLKSPHIVEFYESGNEGDTYYYAMEFVDGETLTSRLKRDKRLPWPEVIDICLQLCRALKAAHNAGIIHRDLKPSNLMMSPDGTLKLTDFGVAQVFASQKLTVTGGIVGTVEYMSPEQAKGQRATKKSDLYSFGAVMYVMLTGRPPFSGKTSLDVIHKHQFAQFDRPALIATDIPKQLDEIVCKLLEKDPDKRFPDSYVLSLRLIEVQKRFAWQSAENANAAAEAAAISAVDITDAGNQPRPIDVDVVSPTVLIPDALGQQIPSGQTVSASVRSTGSPDEPAMGATRTYSSGQVVERRSDQTRAVDGYSQGPGTIMRNLMRKVIEEQKDGGPVGQVLNNTWLQILALMLFLGVGYWVFHSEKAKTGQPLDESATELERIESEVSRFVKIKDNVGKNDPEGKRQLRQALMMYQLGEISRAEKKLEALIVLTKEQKISESVHALAEQFRDALISDRKVAFGAITDAFARATQFVEKKQTVEAEQVWQAVIDLYSDDPKMDGDVQTARKKLAASKAASREKEPSKAETIRDK